MTSPVERLATALADCYRIERELGQGGMATVYFAQDLKHQRRVAIKVLQPELAAVLGAGRFVQEITTTAQLQHPHILPLFDSGEADALRRFPSPALLRAALPLGVQSPAIRRRAGRPPLRHDPRRRRRNRIRHGRRALVCGAQGENAAMTGVTTASTP